MDSKIRVLGGVLVIIVILISIWFFLEFSKSVDIVFPIDSEQEAIAYARNDADVVAFIDDWSSRGFAMDIWAYYYEDIDEWIVSVNPVDVMDAGYVIKFKPDGMIIDKGWGEYA